MKELCGKVPKRVCRVASAERARAWLKSRFRWTMVGVGEGARVSGIEKKADTGGIEESPPTATVACGVGSEVVMAGLWW
jgi:hypothetical protein